MLWTTEKLGPDIVLSDNNAVCSRSSQNGWGVQLLSCWLTQDITTISFQFDQLEGEAQFGVVGRNFFRQSWGTPLAESNHAVALDFTTGHIKYKGNDTTFILRPVGSNSRVNLTVNLQLREMTIEVIGKPGQLNASITVEGIPGEVAPAVCFGPGSHSVRVLGFEVEKSSMKLLGKSKKDLWDDDNVIEPLTLNANNKYEPSAISAEIAEARTLQ
ncbi:hypothetical protein AB1Y20_014167 [Prymnesium parvum]|uniref:Uncharacterized protein n=1 Tax=Prymnesium parvum TaxID=97485 RepID=A0AB34ICX2_PRYPA